MLRPFEVAFFFIAVPFATRSFDSSHPFEAAQQQRSHPRTYSGAFPKTTESKPFGRCHTVQTLYKTSAIGVVDAGLLGIMTGTGGGGVSLQDDPQEDHDAFLHPYQHFHSHRFDNPTPYVTAATMFVVLHGKTILQTT